MAVMKPEQFPTESIPYSSDPASEYRRRVLAGLPTEPPKFRVGQWVWNDLSGYNAQVVRVEWDRGITTPSFWRYHVPGYSTPNMMAEWVGRPYAGHEETAPNCYRVTWRVEFGDDRGWLVIDTQAGGELGAHYPSQAEALEDAPRLWAHRDMEPCATHQIPGCCICL